MNRIFILIAALWSLSIGSALAQTAEGTTPQKMTKVKIETSMGDVIVALYDETPIHRDNFVKLVKEGFYDGLLFHRVIRDFMIQGGDPDSRNADSTKTLGGGGLGTTLEAEIRPELFHKRGALAAARTGDDMNPERRSSSCQFYIVWGQIYKEGQMGAIANRAYQVKMQDYFDKLVEAHREKINALRRNRDQLGLQALQDTLVAETQAAVRKEDALSPAQREAYTTIGGAPHLDGQYTVFGEVVEGLEVVGKIQEVETGRADRPKTDVKIVKATIVE